MSRFVLSERIGRWLDEPQPILRIEFVRIAAPLAILGFMSSRMAHADEWLGTAGFRVPELATPDWRQPFYLPSLPNGLAWGLCVVLVVSGLALSAGFRPRAFAWVFAGATTWIALSDRLAAFSVSKMAPMVAIALALSPCGARFSVDAWLRTRNDRAARKLLPTEVSSGTVRFFQVLLPVIYSASGISKARGDWLHHPYVLWTHLHDTYQTAVTVALANALPARAWTVLQAVTLAFEAGAPLWFAWRRTRTAGMIVGVGMHTMIGLMFGPVRYFAMLMATLLIASFMPADHLDRAATYLTSLAKPKKKPRNMKAGRREDPRELG